MNELRFFTTNFCFTNQKCNKRFKIKFEVKNKPINKVCLLCGEQGLGMQKCKQEIDITIKKQITEILKTLDAEIEAKEKARTDNINKIKEKFIKEERQKLAQSLLNNK